VLARRNARAGHTDMESDEELKDFFLGIPREEESNKVTDW
jgi:hypothetical protein